MRVLIADDNRDAADTLALVVLLWGYEVKVVYDGDSALTAAREFQPDVILLDMQMPKMNGGDVALNLRRQGGLEETMIVVVSANDPNDDRLARYTGLFDAYLGKPCDLDQLHDLLTGDPSNARCPCMSMARSC